MADADSRGIERSPDVASVDALAVACQELFDGQLRDCDFQAFEGPDNEFVRHEPFEEQSASRQQSGQNSPAGRGMLQKLQRWPKVKCGSICKAPAPRSCQAGGVFGNSGRDIRGLLMQMWA